MYARHPHVEEALHRTPQKLGGKCRFFGHGQIAGAGAGYNDHAVARRFGHAAHNTQAGLRAVIQAKRCWQGRRLVGIEARNKHALLARHQHALADSRYLLGGFAFAEHNLGHTGAARPVVVDLGVTQIGKALCGQLLVGSLRGKLARRHLVVQPRQKKCSAPRALSLRAPPHSLR